MDKMWPLFVIVCLYLTNSSPFNLAFQYDTDDDEVVQKKIIDGKMPYVDSRYSERSFGERKLVELMKKCWIYDPDKRISIFEAVDFLKKTIKENEAQSSRN